MKTKTQKINELKASLKHARAEREEFEIKLAESKARYNYAFNELIRLEGYEHANQFRMEVSEPYMSKYIKK